MNDVYEMLGRKQVELESMHAEYGTLLAVLNGVISGEIPAEAVSVDTEKRSWKIMAGKSVNEEPAEDE